MIAHLIQTTVSNNNKIDIFSNVYETFCRIDHMLGHRLSLSRFKKINLIKNIFSDHKMKLEIINEKHKSGKLQKLWKLKGTPLNNQWMK